MCQVQTNHRRMGHALTCTCGCCDCGCGPWPRRYIATVEEKEMLMNYRDSLKKELAGLDEHIKELEVCSK